MEMIKLINAKGDIIERKKIDYEPNTKIWGQRGWKPYEEKKVSKPNQEKEVFEHDTKKSKKKTKKKAK